MKHDFRCWTLIIQKRECTHKRKHNFRGARGTHWMKIAANQSLLQTKIKPMYHRTQHARYLWHAWKQSRGDVNDCTTMVGRNNCTWCRVNLDETNTSYSSPTSPVIVPQETLWVRSIRTCFDINRVVIAILWIMTSPHGKICSVELMWTWNKGKPLLLDGSNEMPGFMSGLSVLHARHTFAQNFQLVLYSKSFDQHVWSYKWPDIHHDMGIQGTDRSIHVIYAKLIPWQDPITFHGTNASQSPNNHLLQKCPRDGAFCEE